MAVRRLSYKASAAIMTGLLVVVMVVLSACAGLAATTKHNKGAVIDAVGAENEYANVISQIGGKYVHVTAIESNPNTDPHDFEASPSVAHVVSSAELVVQNGLGYDTYMNRIEAATPSKTRKVIDVQQLLGLAATTKNPHLWYSPTTMPIVAKAIAKDLSALSPGHSAYFKSNDKRFNASLTTWDDAIERLRAKFPDMPVATTEPVGDYLLNAIGADIKTPWPLAAAIMNGTDPAPQDVSLEETLLNKHEVRVFVYNQQVVDSLTESWLALAKKDHIPVVGVYETMPINGYTYQSWMLAETNALYRAFADKVSTTKL